MVAHYSVFSGKKREESRKRCKLSRTDRESRIENYRGGKLKIGDWREERITDKPRATSHGRRAVSCGSVGGR